MEQKDFVTVKGIKADSFTVHLAWDEDKSVLLPRTGSTEQDSCMAFGYLWSKYSTEIIKHILETNEPHNATPLETINARLQHIENEITQAKETGLRRISVLQKALVAMQVECDNILPESSPYDRVRRWIRDNPEMVKKLRKE